MINVVIEYITPLGLENLILSSSVICEGKVRLLSDS